MIEEFKGIREIQRLREAMFVQVERPRSLEDFCDPRGVYGLLHIRDGEVINEVPFNNIVLNTAKAYMLDAAFNSGTQHSNWYLGLISGASTPSLSASDTAASHTGWTEFVSYNESVRQTWTQGASSGNIVAGATPAVFTIGTVATNTYVAGGFVISDNTKSGTAGLLWSEGLYTNPVPVQTTDIFKLGYLTGL